MPLAEIQIKMNIYLYAIQKSLFLIFSIPMLILRFYSSYKWNVLYSNNNEIQFVTVKAGVFCIHDELNLLVAQFVVMEMMRD